LDSKVYYDSRFEVLTGEKHGKGKNICRKRSLENQKSFILFQQNQWNGIYKGVRKMRKKTSSLISSVAVILIILTAAFSTLRILPARVYGNPTASPADSVTVSPMMLVLNSNPETDTYWVNVTSTSASSADYIGAVDILIPTGWTYTSGAVAYGYSFGAPVVGGGWLNFTTAALTFYNGAIANFSIPVTISTIPTVGTWTVYCYQGATASTSNPVTVTVVDNLQFHATMTPNYVANGTSYIYTITVTNDFCPTGIILINVTFPAGTWVFNALLQSTPATWTVHYDNINTFYLSGPNLYEGQSASITVNMTTPVSTVTGEYYWLVKAWNAGNTFLGTYSMKAVVDASTPIVGFVNPNVAYYSVGSGNYIWLNVSISDTPSIEAYGIVVTCNDSRFLPYSTKPYTETDATHFVYYYVNVTAIADGPLGVQVTAVDPAGNTGSGSKSTTIDNTMPQLVSLSIIDSNSLESLHQDASGTYWMKASTGNISVAAAFYNLQTFTGNIYFNSTSYAFVNSTLYYYGYYYENWLPSTTGFNVTGSNQLTINITLTDGSSPTANRYTNTWTIKRDVIPPSAVSFGTTTIICGGIIIPGITATDNVGIDHYAIYLNGTSYWLYPDDMNSSTLEYWSIFATVQNKTVIDLFDSYDAGDVANITIVATDYGSNAGPATTLTVTVLAGMWYPIEMYPKWNLISLPLLPSNTATTSVFSLMLVNGAAGVNFAYGFDNVAKTWALNPATMTDGNGYWVNMKAYDVLIVQGYPVWAPPGSPPPIVQYSLKQGWNLAGFTETDSYYAPDYVASLQSTLVLQSYFRFVYAWNAQNQNWFTIDLTGNYWPYYIYPGQGFWIYMYNDQTLIPPV